MATGPEHYTEAERLLGGRHVPADDELSLPANWFPPTTDQLLEAIGHGLLALAAAAGLNDTEGGKPASDHRAWVRVAGVKEAGDR